ncbi:MAG: tripartite tricarboxylate transporter substrate binding protein [Eubacteriaceae bacterium]
MFKKSILFILILMLLIGITNGVSAQFPEKEIEWVIWSSPGGGSDVTARTVAIPMRRELGGHPLVIVNMPGGDGARAIEYVMQKPADGYTWLFTTGTLITAIERGLVDYEFEDFIHVAMLNYDAESIAVRANGDIQTIDELVKLGKERPLKWGVTGLGDSEHVRVDLFARRTGVQYDPVVYQGGGENMAALLEGSIDCIMGNPTEILGQVEGGNVKILAVTTPERLEVLPDVPTIVEEGYDVVSGTLRGISVKAGTPPEVVDKIEELFLEAANSEIYQEFLKDNAISPEYVRGSEDYKEFYNREWNDVVEGLKALGIVK